MYDIVQHIVDGYRVVEDSNLVVTLPYKEVRCWKERLFTFPWKPLKKFKVVYRTEPSKEILLVDNKLVCHPTVAKELRKLPF